MYAGDASWSPSPPDQALVRVYDISKVIFYGPSAEILFADFDLRVHKRVLHHF